LVPVVLAGILAAGLMGGTEAVAQPASGTQTVVLGQDVRPVSEAQVERTIASLYRAHPGIATFVAQDVTYSRRSLDVVLNACTDGGARASTTSQVQSGRLLACAPLIFLLYSYGQKEAVPQAIRAAQELFSYAVTQVQGPLDAQSVLGGVLQSWGLPVVLAARPGGTGASRSGAPPPAGASNSAAEKSVVAATQRAILAKGSVHLVVEGFRDGSRAVAEKITGDIGTISAAESLSAEPASAAIRVTPGTAYFSGDTAGLTQLIGLPAAAAKRAGSKWVEMPAGTSEYNDFAREDTISALPASILPTSANSVKLKREIVSGRKLDVLAWGADAGGTTSGQLEETLVVPASSSPLPLSETTVAGGNIQTVTFTRWGEHFSVVAPPSSETIPYSRAEG
jgi:hypothetical protein